MIKRLFPPYHSETLLLLACLWHSWVENCPPVHDQKKTKMADSHGLEKVVAYCVSPSEELIILHVSMEVSNLVKRFPKKQHSCLEFWAQCLMQNIKKIWSLQTILPTPQLSLVIIKLSKMLNLPASQSPMYAYYRHLVFCHISYLLNLHCFMILTCTKNALTWHLSTRSALAAHFTKAKRRTNCWRVRLANCTISIFLEMSFAKQQCLATCTM